MKAATVIPAITAVTTNLSASAATMTITGFGFDASTPGNNVLTFNKGAAGTVTAATATTLTVSLGTKPTSAGSLTASVAVNTIDSGTAVQVATVIPVVTSSSTQLAANASTITIAGFGFDLTQANNVITFNNGAVGSVTTASNTSLTVTFSTKPAAAGDLSVVIVTNGAGDGNAVQVATVKPVITSSTANLAANATTLVINGFGFDTAAGDNIVTLDDGAAGTVTSATNTSMTVTFSTKPVEAGVLSASVATDSINSGTAVSVATVVPVIVANPASIIAADATSVTFAGYGFDTTLANNSISFDDGAVGTIASATNTSMTVNFTTKPTTAGLLSATVTTNSVAGSATVVASVSPVVTANSSAKLAANASTVLIVGLGFDTTAANNTVVFDSGATGTVASATASLLTVTLVGAPAAGNLNAIVTTNSIINGSAVQVATVRPVVTTSTANLNADASSITINGYGFDPTAANNSVSFNNGAAGTVTQATSTSLTVSLTTTPTTAGSLTAIVTSNSVASGAAVQVATVVPVITSDTTDIAANAATVTINGFGFSTTPGNNVVTFDNGATGTVTASTATALTVTFANKPTEAGSLSASVSVGGVNSSTVQIASVIPVVTANSGLQLAANATTMTIYGVGFDTTAGNNTVVFNNDAVGSVTASTATTLSILFSVKPTTAGSLTAVVTTNGKENGAAVQVATVIPVVTSSAADLTADTTTLTINGYGFDPTAGNNLLTFNDSAVGTVTTATATSLTVTFSTTPASAGSLTAIVTTNSAPSGAGVQVATVKPVVTEATADLAANATSLTINGYGFSTIAGDNIVTFNNGALGTVTAATATSLTVSITKAPNAVGSLTASVSSSTLSTAAPVQVATVIPVVTAITDDIAANASGITIYGLGFDSTAANNTVVFNNGAVGSVTGATGTTLTISFSTKPTSAGSLTAVVTTNTLSSGTPVQVARVVPVITTSSANLNADANSVTIAGFGFSSTALSNVVTFNNGASGTVTAATPTSLTVTFSAKPTSAGSLTAYVTTNSVVSGSGIQVATVRPVVTAATTSLSSTATTVTIAGFALIRPHPTTVCSSITARQGTRHRPPLRR
ncbi:MAG: hypothetical protein U0892_16285 [Pirellulales bacterium]